MKKCLVSIACILLAAVSAFGQAKVPATLVSVVDTNFDVIELSTANQYFAPTGRTWATAQHVFDAIDDMMRDSVMVSSDGWVFLAPTAETAQATFDWLDAYVGTNGLLRGTNIVGATFSNGQWTVDSQTAGLLPGTNILGAVYNPTTLVWRVLEGMPGTNIFGASYDTNSLSWTIDAPGVGTNYFMASSITPVAFESNVHTLAVFTADHDPRGMFVGTNSAFRPPVAGLYALTARIRVSLGSVPVDHRVMLYLCKNGDMIMMDREGDKIVTADVLSFSTFVRAATGDYYQVYTVVDGKSGSVTNADRVFQGALLSADD